MYMYNNYIMIDRDLTRDTEIHVLLSMYSILLVPNAVGISIL